MEQALFGAPIPGQGLMTHGPGDRPWERPAEIDTVDDALAYYFTNLRDPERIDDIMTVIDMGLPIEPVVKTLTTSATMNGIHTLDVGLIVAPVLSEFLAAVARTEKENLKTQMMLRMAIDKGIQESGEDDEGVALLKEMAATLEEETVVEEADTAAENDMDSPPEPVDLQTVKPKGLMAREGM